jgi:hypothetical protein
MRSFAGEKTNCILEACTGIFLALQTKRVLLPEYVKVILERPLSDDVLEDLDAVRGER